MKKYSLTDLGKIDNWEEAVIVFTESSFKDQYSELERSYKISKNNKYFSPMMGGTSLFGSCLDGKDDDVRLDTYMKLLPHEGLAWVPDYCYFIK